MAKNTIDLIKMKSLKKLTQKLSGDDRKLLSYAIDEIERSMYFETRDDILFNLKKEYDRGGEKALSKLLKYLIEKPKPFFKDR